LVGGPGRQMCKGPACFSVESLAFFFWRKKDLLLTRFNFGPFSTEDSAMKEGLEKEGECHDHPDGRGNAARHHWARADRPLHALVATWQSSRMLH